MVWSWIGYVPFPINVEYIEKAKDAIKLSNPINVDLNIIGKTDFTIYEDLCLISGQNNGRTISVYQLPNFNYLGSYVHVGNGPGEVLFPPFVGSISIKQQPDGIHAYFLNLKGGIIDWNVTESIKTKATIANTTDLRLPNDVVSGIYINDTSLLLKKINYLLKMHIPCVSIPPALIALGGESL